MKTKDVAEVRSVEQKLIPNPYAVYVAEKVMEWADKHHLTVTNVSFENDYKDTEHNFMQFSIDVAKGIYCSGFAVRVPIIHTETKEDSFAELAKLNDKAEFSSCSFRVDLQEISRDKSVFKSEYTEAFTLAFEKLPEDYNELVISLNGK